MKTRLSALERLSRYGFLIKIPVRDDSAHLRARILQGAVPACLHSAGGRRPEGSVCRTGAQTPHGHPHGLCIRSTHTGSASVPTPAMQRGLRPAPAWGGRAAGGGPAALVRGARGAPCCCQRASERPCRTQSWRDPLRCGTRAPGQRARFLLPWSPRSPRHPRPQCQWSVTAQAQPALLA